MKMKKLLTGVASLAIVLFAGCAHHSIDIDGQVRVGNKVITGVHHVYQDAWGHDATTLLEFQTPVAGAATGYCASRSETHRQVYASDSSKGCERQHRVVQQRQSGCSNCNSGGDTTLINANNQGGPGWVNNAMQGAVAGLFQGAGLAASGGFSKGVSVVNKVAGGAGGKGGSSRATGGNGYGLGGNSSSSSSSSSSSLASAAAAASSQ